MNYMEGYEPVAERIAKFYKRYPEGSITDDHWKLTSVGDRTFIVCSCKVYRAPTDLRPGIGLAWEPFPGKTSFQRDSELMVCQTSAWGRGLAAIGLGGKVIATKEEVENRPQAKSERGQKLQLELAKRKVPQDKIKLAMAACGVTVGRKSLTTVFASLTDEEVNSLWQTLSE